MKDMILRSEETATVPAEPAQLPSFLELSVTLFAGYQSSLSM